MEEKLTPLTISSLHACISVADLDATTSWYQDVLGFEIFQQHNYPDYAVRVVYMKSQGVELELVETQGSTLCRRDDPPAGHVALRGISQLSFRVDNAEQAAEQLKKRSINITFGPIHAAEFTLNAFFIRDNEGNLIEFIERL